ncbi:MAG: dTDP-4-dehydrorhamnose reductase [Oscillospiraceae bacterium]
MKILVTGANGQLGSDLLRLLSSKNIPNIGIDISDCDITDRAAVEKLFRRENPTHVVHCAAFTAVDKAETERELCEKINVCGTENIAEECRKTGAEIVYISSDYVYSGNGENPQDETAEIAPKNFYGRTKYDGEMAIMCKVENYYIVRTSWVFGKSGGNFVKTMLRLAQTNPEISVVSDQIGSPTYTPDLSAAILELIKKGIFGVYNITNSGFCSWYEFACEIFRQEKIPVKVHPILTKNYKTAAERPLNSKLSKEKYLKIGNCELPDWKNALERFLGEIKLEQKNDCKS